MYTIQRDQLKNISGGGNDDGAKYKSQRNEAMAKGALGAWMGFLQRGYQKHLEIQQGVQQRCRERMEHRKREQQNIKAHNDHCVSKGYPTLSKSLCNCLN